MSLLQDQFVEIPINSGTYDEKSRGRPASVPEPVDSFILSPMGTPQFKKSNVNSLSLSVYPSYLSIYLSRITAINYDHQNAEKVNWVIDWMSKVSKKTDSFAHGVCEHGNCLEMVKRKKKSTNSVNISGLYF
eukprot:TRINITY_DN21829_c0_g1_i1.p1 TRINITY_DN21829_c0_g1~~TRINITY_DN21829_c0_g1_i1.p1  ORF type:complete len:132 (-),score=12.64 TRINITY_DN21829_c0_g1_i1:61-456(-)